MSFRRTAMLAAFAVVASTSAAWWASTLPPDAPPVPPGEHPHAVLVSASAGVERSGDGGWTKARVGEAFDPVDAIRTGKGDRAELSLGRGATVVLDERTVLVLRDLDPASQALRLVRGRVEVDHRWREGTRELRVEDASGSIVATSDGGRWSAVASADSLAVAAVEGEVRIESAGAAVDVPAGTQSAAWRGQAPIAPARPVPKAVVLRVAQALADRRREACLALQVDVASEVSANGEPVPVDRQGRAVVLVPEDRQHEPVDVVVRHVTGAVERRHLGCVKQDADVKGFEVRWDAH